MGIGTKYGITAETGNNIQTNGLIFYVDPAYQKSYITGSLPQSVFNLASGSLTPTGSLKAATEFQGPLTASWVFDGTDDYIDCGEDICNFAHTDSFTISGWINFALDSTADTIVGRQTFPFPGWNLGVDASNKAQLTISENPFTDAGADSSALSSGWRHIVGVWNGSAAKVYVDGSDDTTTFSNGSLSSITGTKPLLIAAIGVPGSLVGQFGKGNIGPIMIYDRELSAADVLQNYNAQKGRFGY